MLKDYKYSVTRFLLLYTSNVIMSEGTFCRVEVHIYLIIYLFHVINIMFCTKFIVLIYACNKNEYLAENCLAVRHCGFL